MTKINFPNRPSIKPLEDYPNGQFYILESEEGSKYLVQKTLIGGGIITLIDIGDGRWFFLDLKDAERRIFRDKSYTITPVEVEINIL